VHLLNKNNSPFCRLTIMVFAGFLGIGTNVVSASQHDEHAGHDMSGHDMSGHSVERDEKGRRLHGMKHEVSEETLTQLQANILGWENITAEEVALSMVQMGPNYEWYISDDGVHGRTGALVLFHGFRDRGDKVFKDRLQPYAEVFPLALSPGMSMVMSQHIQLGLDDLVAAGVENVVVVPIVSTEHNTMIRQWQYIFGLQDDYAYADVPQVETEAQVVFTDPPGDDPFVAEILLDYATELSVDPANEVVIIASHGPSAEADNELQLALMDNLAKIVKEDGGFSAVYSATLQDDAPAEVRSANVEKLRNMVVSSQAGGTEVIIVTNLIGAHTIQSKLRKDLKGLDYKFNAKGLVQHDSFVEWIGETVRIELEKNSRASLN
jgi:hypothetical protein